VFEFLRRLFAPAPPDPLGGLDTARTRLIVGLGNPGPEYADTRHNVGFRCLDELARRCQTAWVKHGPSQSMVSRASAGDLILVLAKPHTYMNRSGSALVALQERLNRDLQKVLVVYDDMDLPFGTLRLRERGSPGTHNGMRSVVGALHTEDVPRLRIGIGQSSPGGAIDHVLSGFSEEEQETVRQLVSKAADAAYAWATEGAVAAMNRYNG
jgi:peptidyl-tRNA hydrolase, PTH1 family